MSGFTACQHRIDELLIRVSQALTDPLRWEPLRRVVRRRRSFGDAVAGQTKPPSLDPPPKKVTMMVMPLSGPAPDEFDAARDFRLVRSAKDDLDLRLRLEDQNAFARRVADADGITAARRESDHARGLKSST